jgi:hypothetical protein
MSSNTPLKKSYGALPFKIPDDQLGFPLTTSTKKETIFRNYKIGKVLDQGDKGICVDMALTGLLNAEPISQTPCQPLEIYKAARKLGKTPDDLEGCQLNHAVDYLIDKKIIKRKYWTCKSEEVTLYLNTISPIVMSIPWYEKMNTTEKDGRITLGGNLIGYHAVLAFRFDGLHNRIWIRNSWGSEWGVSGNCYIEIGNLEKLLNRGGIACALVE